MKPRQYFTGESIDLAAGAWQLRRQGRFGTAGVEDAFARNLIGDACGVPADAIAALRPLPAPAALCSRQRPFGIHADLTGRCCPRCGWVPDRRRRRRA